MPNAQLNVTQKIQSMTAQYILKNAPICYWGGKNYITPGRSAAENALSQHCQNHKERRKNTSQESTTANLVTGGGKTQDENKKPFKNIFPEKWRPVLNTVQKRLEQSSIFLSLKIWPQWKISNTTAALENWGFQMSHSKNKSKKNILWWKLLQTIFFSFFSCAAHTAITKCTPLQPTQSQEHPPGKMH